MNKLGPRDEELVGDATARMTGGFRDDLANLSELARAEAREVERFSDLFGVLEFSFAIQY
jgi:hypothetical protein